MPRVYLPYTGNYLTYGEGPEHNYFSGDAAPASTPLVVTPGSALDSTPAPATPGPGPTDGGGANGGDAQGGMGNGEPGGAGSDRGGQISDAPGYGGKSDPIDYGSIGGIAGGILGLGIGGIGGLVAGPLGGVIGNTVDVMHGNQQIDEANAAWGGQAPHLGLGNVLSGALNDSLVGRITGWGQDPMAATRNAIGEMKTGLAQSDPQYAMTAAPNTPLDAAAAQAKADAIAAQPQTTNAPIDLGFGPRDSLGNPQGAGYGPGGYGGYTGGGYQSGTYESGLGPAASPSTNYGDGGGGAGNNGGSGDTGGGSDSSGNGGGDTGSGGGSSGDGGGGGGYGGGASGARIQQHRLIPYAAGGNIQVQGYQRAMPSRAIDGPGDGLSDSVPARIDGAQPAALSSGEHVLPSDFVSHVGNGSSAAGHRKIKQMVNNVRRAKTGTARQPRPVQLSLGQLAGSP